MRLLGITLLGRTCFLGESSLGQLGLFGLTLRGFNKYNLNELIHWN